MTFIIRGISTVMTVRLIVNRDRRIPGLRPVIRLTPVKESSQERCGQRLFAGHTRVLAARIPVRPADPLPSGA
jgi:hypothetical protein